MDLLVIGTVGLAELAPALRKVEEHLGREVNVTSYSQAEFRTKVGAGDHFLTEVLRGSKQFVKGGQRDLDEVVGKPRRSKASNIQRNSMTTKKVVTSLGDDLGSGAATTKINVRCRTCQRRRLGAY